MPALGWHTAPDSTRVCHCMQVDKGTIVAAIRAGADSLAAIQRATGAGTGRHCAERHPEGRCCVPDIQALLQSHTRRIDPRSDGCCAHPNEV